MLGVRAFLYVCAGSGLISVKQVQGRRTAALAAQAILVCGGNLSTNKLFSCDLALHYCITVPASWEMFSF